MAFTWAIFSEIPTLHAYYYPDIEKTNNSVDDFEKERTEFNSSINLLWLVLLIVMCIYIFLNPSLLFFRNIIIFLVWGSQLFVVLNVFRIVFYSIVGVKKNYLYFSAQHNSMRILSTTIFTFLNIIPLSKLLPLINKNNFSGLYDFWITVFYFSINIVFNFFILCIVMFFMQDIFIYIKQKSLYKKVRTNLAENFKLSLDFETYLKNVWMSIYSVNRSLKFLIKVYYSILVLATYGLKIIEFMVILIKRFRNKIIKYLRKLGIVLISMDPNYIIALSARLSALISIIITFIIFKYESIISQNGLDIMEFVFTIFLLPVIFNEILKLRKAKSLKLYKGNHD